MHSSLCQRCEGGRILITLRAGVAFRRDPTRMMSHPIPIRCPGCRGQRMFPIPGRTLAGRRLPSI